MESDCENQVSPRSSLSEKMAVNSVSQSRSRKGSLFEEAGHKFKIDPAGDSLSKD